MKKLGSVWSLFGSVEVMTGNTGCFDLIMVT